MLSPNTLLQDRYLVLRLLGQGGMGAVYQATDRKFGNAVAVKETFYSNEQFRQAFSQEARLLNRLRHPALPVVMDYFSAGDKQFLVMQYIPGKDLAELLEERKSLGQGAFLTSQVMQWADQLLDGLEYLHSQETPVIHRDIKPQNLKLTPRGEVILLDFGLAKGVVADQPKSSRSIQGYTPHYASLEQIRGTGTDARSDIYSLGATLYHLLTGVMPPDAMTRMAAEMMGEPELLHPITQLNPAVPPQVAKVIERAMSQAPNSRLGSASKMRQALRNACRNRPTMDFHRAATLTDGWPDNIEALPEQDSIPDSVIILLDEHKAEPDWQSLSDSSSGRQMSLGKTKAGNKGRLRSARIAWYAMTALLLMTLTTALMFYREVKSKPGLMAGAAELTAIAKNNSDASLVTAMRQEVLSYYLEVVSTDNITSRATGMMPLAFGSRFKFHFKPRQSGYLYLIALGKNGRQQTFLTERPMPASGVTTNWSAGGYDFQFPDNGQWFMLPREAESAPFTVIFSSEPLTSPGFLASSSGHELDETELQQLAELRKSSSSKSLTLVAFSEENQPAVAAQVLADRYKNDPLVFDISIQKK
ncbi:MAG: serine/threonine protein kinase [Acidobacteria bacterium]|nr:serine/threonine protein kinase [Acidobacteriota bacterium]